MYVLIIMGDGAVWGFDVTLNKVSHFHVFSRDFSVSSFYRTGNREQTTQNDVHVEQSNRMGK